ncbi:MAG TPA: type IV pilus twitching motility protein PilT [Abditibacteriaceae bacterium]|nr:type IV pilus twitching motility protein PilT [Abditibacteriaceae bacterium]
MAQLDKFIDMMVQRQIERALLVNDKPAHLYAHGQESVGPIIPGVQLQNAVQEIIPPNLRPQLATDGGLSFPYQSPHGLYEIGIERGNGSLQVAISAAGQDTDVAALRGAAAAAAIGASRSGAAVPETAAPAPEAGPSYAAASNGAGASGAATTAPRSGKKIEHIDELFRMMKAQEASDLHLSSEEHPVMRLQGIIKKLDDYEVSTNEQLKKILFAIAPKRNQDQWEAERDTDFAYDMKGVARFRCNLFEDRHGIGGVFRLIPSEVLTVEQLKLPKAMTDLCYLSKGLVVVTGPTGSGKSTTLAALIDFVNKNREDHIITIEDPIEFVHHNIKCLINQREVHVNTKGFKRALVAALREDPDIVLVGEMRDLETIAIAIETAETGHLVFGTLHTTTAPSTVDRIIDQFPADQQAQIRVMLSESLKGVIAQTLLRTKDGKRVAAHEILLVPTAVANLIREGKTFQLPSQMQIGKALGMLMMNESILEFVKSGRVDPMEGYVKSVDKLSLLQSYEANDIPFDIDAHKAVAS